jgi:site-specific DNA-cytosine methylase
VLRDLASCLASREGAPGLPENGAGSGGVADVAQGGVGDPTAETFIVAGTLGATDLTGNGNEESFLVPAFFDGSQITSKADRTRVEPGRPSGTLHGDARQCVAFHATQSPVNGHVSPALGASSQIGVADLGVTHSLTASSGATEDGTGRGTPRAASHGGTAVRRLMPVECERLMGWPDGHTERRADGSLIPDGPRYRMIGNGVVMPVAAWIGRRLRAALLEPS